MLNIHEATWLTRGIKALTVYHNVCRFMRENAIFHKIRLSSETSNNLNAFHSSLKFTHMHSVDKSK